MFFFLLWWCPFKIQKEKRAGLQFTSTDYLSIVSTPLRIRWTIPLRRRSKEIRTLRIFNEPILLRALDLEPDCLSIGFKFEEKFLFKISTCNAWHQPVKMWFSKCLELGCLRTLKAYWKFKGYPRNFQCYMFQRCSTICTLFTCRSKLMRCQK
jgi:hypothetical protein